MTFTISSGSKSALMRAQKLTAEQTAALALIEEGRDQPIDSMVAPSGRKFLIWTAEERQLLESLGWS